MGKGKKKKKNKKKKQSEGAQQQGQSAEPQVQSDEPGERTGVALLFWVALGWIRHFPDWAYKHKRGLWVRWGSVGTLSFLGLYGLRSLYISVDSANWWRSTLREVYNPLLGESFSVTNGDFR